MGFTLIELMLVVAIIGLLAAIAIPKFANVVIKAKEASVKGKLGSLRSAISIYYSDNDGFNGRLNAPSAPLAWLIPKYLDAIPFIAIPTVAEHTEENLARNANTGPLDDSTYNSISHQAFFYSAASGDLRVNCTHTDSKGTTWSLW